MKSTLTHLALWSLAIGLAFMAGTNKTALQVNAATQDVGVVQWVMAVGLPLLVAMGAGFGQMVTSLVGSGWFAGFGSESPVKLPEVAAKLRPAPGPQFPGTILQTAELRTSGPIAIPPDLSPVRTALLTVAAEAMEQSNPGIARLACDGIMQQAGGKAE